MTAAPLGQSLPAGSEGQRRYTVCAVAFLPLSRLRGALEQMEGATEEVFTERQRLPGRAFSPGERATSHGPGRSVRLLALGPCSARQHPAQGWAREFPQGSSSELSRTCLTVKDWAGPSESNAGQRDRRSHPHQGAGHPVPGLPARPTAGLLLQESWAGWLGGGTRPGVQSLLQP